MLKPAMIRKFKKIVERHDALTGELHSLDTTLMSSVLERSMDLKYWTLEHFTIQEFISEKVFAEFGEGSLMFMDVRILWTADAIREYFDDEMYINLWSYGLGGKYQYRGFREPDCVTGAMMSQHRFGRAIDFTIKGIDSKEIRKEILTHSSEPSFRFVRAMELDTNHVHIDCRNVPQSEVLTFRK